VCVTPSGTWLLLHRSFSVWSEGLLSFAATSLRMGESGERVEASCRGRETLSFCLVLSFPALLKGMICFSRPQRLLLALGGESESSDESFSIGEF